MKYLHAIIAFAAAAAVSACGQSEPEKIQAKAEDTVEQLENEAAQITADAENGVQSAVDTLENQAAALEQPFEGNEAGANQAEANEAAANRQ